MDEELLKILACPWCVTRPDSPPEGLSKGQFELLREDENPKGLKCLQCGRIYRIDDGIPNLLIDEATLPSNPEP